MGAKDSKPVFITYDEAVKRVSESEFRRLSDAFKKCAGGAGAALSRAAFIRDVLGDGVPCVVADWLYAACGGTRRGISFKDLLCGLVVLTKGTQEEKIKFLWTLYCNEAGTHVVRCELSRALAQEGAAPRPEALAALFGRGERAGPEQFKTWLLARPPPSVLARWLLYEPGPPLTSDLETPTFYQTLAGVTHLEERDICALEKVFWWLRGRAVSGQLDVEALSPLLSPPVPRAALPGLLLALDENRDGHVDFKELCCGLSAACRGPTCERIKFCFKVFDVDRDGFLNQSELRHMTSVLCFVANEAAQNQSRPAASTPGKQLFDSDEWYESLRQQICGENKQENFDKRPSNDKNKNRQRNDLSNEYVDNFKDVNLSRVMRNDEKNSLLEFLEKESSLEMEAEKEWGLSQEDFLIWSVEKAEALVAPFLQLIFEVCHIVLGLRPQCKHQEQAIVLGWLSREVRRGYSVGQFWYLVSAEWWSAWRAYTGAPGPCSACGRHTHSSQLDEAIVCDEGFNSTESMGDLLGRSEAETGSLGSNSSSSGISSSCSSRTSRHPGPIDNSQLLLPYPNKVRTLTGEGGHLRRDLTLSQHRDFELVPDSLWKALAQWYGGPNPLPRQVIQPPNSDVELELYPRNLKLLRHVAPSQNAGGTPSSWSGMVGGYGAAALSSVGMASSYPSAGPQTPTRQLAYTAAFSRLATVKQVCDFICAQLCLPREDVRLWLVSGTAAAGSGAGSPGELLEDEGRTLSELGATDGQRLLIEVRNKDLTWPEELGALSLSAASGESRTLVGASTPHPPGATGLHNLGNTCFMNAALQAVWNTGPLTKYFTQGMHLYELNTDNPHGTGGALAQRYGELCKEVWSSGARSVAPLRVRWCVWRNAARFSGGGQHDSQELLAWLLDALHEDLNRAAVTPYAELRDSGGRPDQVVAQEAWEQHTSRNQSIITDLFYGQLKSKVTCSSCGHESVRFDPFNLLSLPLPMESFILVEVLVILLDGSVPVKYGMRLSSEGRYLELKRQLSALCGVAAGALLLGEAGGAWPARPLPDTVRLRPAPLPLLAYQLPAEAAQEPLQQTHTDVGEGVASSAERLSTWSESSDTPTTGSSLTCKDMKSLDSHNGSSGYSSIQESESHSNCISNQPSSLDSACSSPKKTNPKNSRNQASPTLSSKSASSVAYDSPNIRRKLVSNEILTPIHLPKNGSTDLLHSLKNKLESGDSMRNIDASVNGLVLKDRDVGKKSLGLSYLVGVHRKQSRQELYFLSQHKRRWEVFGAGLVVEAREGASGRDLHGAVWRQVARLLSPPPPTHDQANHATDCDDSLGYTFPFTLRVVGRGGLRCAVCPWTRFCRGCALPCTDEPLLFNITPDAVSLSHRPSVAQPWESVSPPPLSSGGDSPPSCPPPESPTLHRLDMAELRAQGTDELQLAIDWDPTALHLRYQSTRERAFVEHESVAECRRAHTAPVQLSHCLNSFTSEERLEEPYSCTSCREQRPATKKLQIWRLPPVLVIHLKRFLYVNNKWIKSQKVVNFPYDDFDPTEFLASVPQETILRHAELLQHRRHANLMGNHRFLSSSEDEHHIGPLDDSCIAEEDDDVVCGNDEVSSDTEDKTGVQFTSPSKLQSERRRSGAGEAAGERRSSLTVRARQRLQSSSLSCTPVHDDQLQDYHQHRLQPNQDLFHLNYKLVAVVSHSGMMNGGHYVAYALNPNGAWYCYNDSSCRELTPPTQAGAPPQPPPIEPGSAYMLFYERTGLDADQYMPNVEGKAPKVEEAAKLAEGEDSDLKKMCVLS